MRRSDAILATTLLAGSNHRHKDSAERPRDQPNSSSS
jgi:hypothetical protein